VLDKLDPIEVMGTIGEEYGGGRKEKEEDIEEQMGRLDIDEEEEGEEDRQEEFEGEESEEEDSKAKRKGGNNKSKPQSSS
jgi:hypothetical protein